MKKLLALILALGIAIGSAGACKPSGGETNATPDPSASVAPGGETGTPQDSSKPTETGGPVDPTVDPNGGEVNLLDGFALQRIAKLKYGEDYESLYEHMGKDVKIADVVEDENGFACIEDENGELRVLGLDFLSMAMVYNIDPEGSDYADSNEVYAAWWRYYITRWNELLPEIPLYSNEYYDLYNAKIKGVDEHQTNPYWNPADALIDWTSEKADNSIILGNGTEAAGLFRIASFGKSSPIASDADIAKLVNGHSTVVSNKDGNYQWDDTVVKSHTEEVDAEGNKTFTITIHDDLKFSDGTPITAKNYIVATVAGATPVYTEAAGRAGNYISILGWEKEYENYAGPGTEGVKELKGIRLIDEYTFSITVPASQLPYYYDIIYAGFSPYATGLFLPEGIDIHDDGNGCYLDDKFYEKNGDKFTVAAYIQDNMTSTSAEAYKKFPWTGPYMLESYDETTDVATLIKNPNYKGNFEGVVPSIEKVVYKKVVSATQLEDFKTGGIDCIAGITGGAETDEALKAVEESNGAFVTTHYARAGYGKLGFRADYGPVQFTEVRKAIAYCMDRAQFAKNFTGGYGGVVDGPYYTGGWMYKEAKKQGMQLNTYDTSVDSAKAVLIEGGWIYNADGSEYSGTGVRYKKIPGDLATKNDIEYKSKDGNYKTEKIGEDYYMPLVINWFGTSDNPFTDQLQTGFRTNPNIEAAGMYVTNQIGDFPVMQDELQQNDSGNGTYKGTPMYCAFNFATSFSAAVYDFSWNLTIDPTLIERGYSAYYIKDVADIFLLK